MRYSSAHNFVQSPLGQLGTEGDFLLEIAGIPERSAILFHGGNKPKHSTGCVLLGPVGFDPLTGNPELGPKHPLRLLRTAFYGTETPNASPDKAVSIEVSQAVNVKAAVPTAKKQKKKSTAKKKSSYRATDLGGDLSSKGRERPQRDPPQRDPPVRDISPP